MLLKHTWPYGLQRNSRLIMNLDGYDNTKGLSWLRVESFHKLIEFISCI